MGLFGGVNVVADMHTVAAHTRVQADGSEVFVGEHSRWNRGRGARPVRPGRAPEQPESPDQLTLWTL